MEPFKQNYSSRNLNSHYQSKNGSEQGKPTYQSCYGQGFIEQELVEEAISRNQSPD